MVFEQEVIFVVSNLIWQDASVLPSSVSYDHKDHSLFNRFLGQLKVAMDLI